MATAKLVTICAWCPDREKRTADARALGFDVTHGICRACQGTVEEEARRLRLELQSS